MDIRHPRISALFDAKTGELAARGITPTPRESVLLHAACCDVVMPDRSEVSAWLPPVVSIGPVKLYAVTIQARLWLDAYCSRWWSDDYLMDILGTAWAMAHAGKAGAFQDMTHKATARIKITAWAILLPITFEQLREGMRRHFGLDDVLKVESPLEPKADVNPLEWGEVLARACVIAKVSPQDVMTWTEGQLCDVLAKDKDGITHKSDGDKIRTLEALRIVMDQIVKAHEVPT